MLRRRPDHVEMLVLGSGWTGTFLIPELEKAGISHAATTTTGRDCTIPFKFDPDSDSLEPYKNLPAAATILITFPLKGPGQSKHLTSLYRQVHGSNNHWIQLGSSGIFNQEHEGSVSKAKNGDGGDWCTEESDYDKTNERAIAEDELRECVGGCILNLSGLYGGTRVPKAWLPRLAKSKEDVRARKSVHFVHGEDVARAIVAVDKKFTPGKRWIITDMRVYDWYDLILSFSSLTEGEAVEESEAERAKRLQFGKWVGELMIEEGVRALPRSMDLFGRKLDSRKFWETMGIWPRHARLA
jgi:nucleoside-diphosphate-sugar epimerase